MRPSTLRSAWPLDACRHPHSVVPRAVADDGRATGAPATISTAWPPFTNAAQQPRLRSIRSRMRSAASSSPPGRRSSSPRNSPRRCSRPVRWQRGGVEGPGARARAHLFAADLENRLVLIGRLGAVVSAKTTADLKGKRIASSRATRTRGDRQGRPGVGAVGSEEDSLTQLLKGAVDYTLMDEFVVHYIVATTRRNRGEHADRVDAARDAGAALCSQSGTRGRGVDCRAIQRTDTRHDCRPHVSSPAALDWIRADVDGDGVPDTCR